MAEIEYAKLADETSPANARSAIITKYHLPENWAGPNYERPSIERESIRVVDAKDRLAPMKAALGKCLAQPAGQTEWGCGPQP